MRKCLICGGHFEYQAVQITDDKTGQTRTAKMPTCVRCGDTAWSPEQYLALKLKEPVHAG